MANTTGPFEPRNALEHALVAAAADPAQRGPFLRELLDATVLVVGDPSNPGPGGSPALRWANLPDGRACLPFYSSAEWLGGVVRGDVPVLSLPARALFEGTRGSTLALNLGAPVAKEFTPAEISGLLSTGGADVASELGHPDAMALDLPEEDPLAFIASATSVFARHPEVRAAYLGRIHIPTAGTPPHLIVGVEGEGDLRDAMQDANAARESGDDPDGLVDFVAITLGADGVAGWLRDNGRRFYEA